MLFHSTLGALLLISTANAYVWPSPQLDALEAVRFDQLGFTVLPSSISLFVNPCNLFVFASVNSGRSDAADWIRTAYHDMATHNSTDGTGGLDASIRFPAERARAENIGDGFANTIGIVFQVINRYVSMADAIALGAIFAVENCGGPEIPFRGGRTDADEPNAPGVPEPQEDIDSHVASFARQGFTQTEMIGLVACGHTFGGVQHSVFPDIVNVLNDPTSTEDVAHFDSTFVTFDNNIATEYISGTTQNPLVVGFNDTTNSDKRIFGSDGNATMHSFANSPKLFASTCADLFAHMLDTVPTGVQLTDVITPLPVKPASVDLILNGDILQLSGFVRLWNMTEDPSRVVRMLWDDHAQGTGNTTMGFAGTSSATHGKHSAAWYGFNDTVPHSPIGLDPAAGVKSLSFVVNGKLEDQGGLGFAVQDGYMLSATSCSMGNNPLTGRVDIAVRNGVNPTRVYLEMTDHDSVGRIVITEIDVPRPSHPVAANSAYSLWSLNLSDQNVVFLTFNIGAEIDGVKYSTTNVLRLNSFAPCPK